MPIPHINIYNVWFISSVYLPQFDKLTYFQRASRTVQKSFENWMWMTEHMYIQANRREVKYKTEPNELLWNENVNTLIIVKYS